MTSLTDFLLACIADDEAVARAAITVETQERTYFDGSKELLVDKGVWKTGPHGEYDEPRITGTFMTIYDEGGHSAEQARHIARHDPARVLAECAAKRKIVALFVEAEEGLTLGDGMVAPWADERIAVLEPVVALLALPYADRPGFREEWRP